MGKEDIIINSDKGQPTIRLTANDGAIKADGTIETKGSVLAEELLSSSARWVLDASGDLNLAGQLIVGGELISSPNPKPKLLVASPKDRNVIIRGKIRLQDSQKRNTLELDADGANLFLFSSTSGADLILHDKNDIPRVHLQAVDGIIRCLDHKGVANIFLGTVDGSSALALGGANRLPGRIVLRSGNHQDRIKLIAQTGVMQCLDENGKPNVFLGADNGSATLALGGDNKLPGRVAVRSGNLQDRITLTAQTGAIECLDEAGGPNIFLGPDNGLSTLALGGDNKLPGRIALRSEGFRDRITLDAQTGSIQCFDKTGQPFAFLGQTPGGPAELSLGGPDLLPGRINIRSDFQDRITLDGITGDIKLSGGDCAEDFDVDPYESAEPGSVMVIASEESLRPCSSPYDTRVAGIISGAGNKYPGIRLDSRSGAPRHPVALSGKVFCKADAMSVPIQLGDLLTTSSIPGHAMKVVDHSRAFGSVLGKALAPLSSGCGLIPVLVSLQ